MGIETKCNNIEKQKAHHDLDNARLNIDLTHQCLLLLALNIWQNIEGKSKNRKSVRVDKQFCLCNRIKNENEHLYISTSIYTFNVYNTITRIQTHARKIYLIENKVLAGTILKIVFGYDTWLRLACGETI